MTIYTVIAFQNGSDWHGQPEQFDRRRDAECEASRLQLALGDGWTVHIEECEPVGAL